VEEVADLPAQSLHQSRTTLGRVAGDVHYRLAVQLRDAVFELRRGAIDRYHLDIAPRSVRRIRLALSPADADDIVPGLYEGWRKVRADVSGTAYDDDAHRLLDCPAAIDHQHVSDHHVGQRTREKKHRTHKVLRLIPSARGNCLVGGPFLV